MFPFSFASRRYRIVLSYDKCYIAFLQQSRTLIFYSLYRFHNYSNRHRMSGLNIVRRFVGCRQLQGFCGPLVARRASTTIRQASLQSHGTSLFVLLMQAEWLIQRNLNNDGHGSSDLEGPRKKASFASRYVPTRDEFHRLTKVST